MKKDPLASVDAHLYDSIMQVALLESCYDIVALYFDRIYAVGVICKKGGIDKHLGVRSGLQLGANDHLGVLDIALEIDRMIEELLASCKTTSKQKEVYVER